MRIDRQTDTHIYKTTTVTFAALVANGRAALRVRSLLLCRGWPSYFACTIDRHSWPSCRGWPNCFACAIDRGFVAADGLSFDVLYTRSMHRCNSGRRRDMPGRCHGIFHPPNILSGGIPSPSPSTSHRMNYPRKYFPAGLFILYSLL